VFTLWSALLPGVGSEVEAKKLPQPPSSCAPLLPATAPAPEVPKLLIQTVVRVSPQPDPSGGLAAGGANKANEEFLPLQLQQKLADDPKERTLRNRVKNAVYQQHFPRSTVPFWLYNQSTQWKVASCCAAIFGVLGALLLIAASGTVEVVIPYTATDSSLNVDIPNALSGEVLIWYDVPDVRINDANFVKSKEKYLFDNTFNKKNCDDTKKIGDILWRRQETCIAGSSSCFDFLGNISGASTSAELSTMPFRPCGLSAIAMFLDEFRLFSKIADVRTEVLMDETDLSYPADEKYYSKIQRNGDVFTIEEERTWLTPGNYDHWKVWNRSPASPRVRNLWARKAGGLAAGQYTLEITKNSPIWTAQWAVSEKRLVLSEASTLGSKGSSHVLGVLCIVIGAVELLIAVGMGFAPAKKKAATATTTVAATDA